MTTFKKLAAVLCSATTLLAAGAAMSASAEGGIVISGSDDTYTLAELEATDRLVPVVISMENNPGYAGAGIGIYYGELQPLLYDDGSVDFSGGVATQNAMLSVENKPSDVVSERMIGLACASSATLRKSGAMLNLQFYVPEDAQPGDVYEITLLVDQITTLDDQELESTSKSAFVRIAGETTTTTTETTTTTTETTTTTTETTTTTTETTTTETTTETTTTETTTETTTSETTTTTAAPEPTGDAGVALAVAGLLTAAGTALVVRKKRG